MRFLDPDSWGSLYPKFLIIIGIYETLPSLSWAQALQPNPNKVRIVQPGGSFKFDCPPVDEPHRVTSYQVSWMHDNAVWLKINEGHLLITNHLSSFYPRQVGNNRNVVTVALNHYRYKFNYDELNGVFTMSINEVETKDAGIWKCTIETRRGDGERNYLMYSDYRQLKVGYDYTRATSSASSSSNSNINRNSNAVGASSYQTSHRSRTSSVSAVAAARHSSGSSVVSGPAKQATFTHVDGQRVGDAIVFQRQAGAAGSKDTLVIAATGAAAAGRNRRLRSRYNHVFDATTRSRLGVGQTLLVTILVLAVVKHYDYYYQELR